MTGTRDARRAIRPDPVSGQQFDISHGAQRVTVVEVGGGLRQYTVDGRELLAGYDAQTRCTGARGLPLIPWPNRIRDGAYTFAGRSYQVPLTEPDKHNAIHGFLRWRNWTCRGQDTAHVSMGTVLRPMMGYPFTLDVTVDYRLDEDGLTIQTTATNVGEGTCPYGAGHHPYLSVGTELIDPCTLQLEAGRYLPTDERGLPTGRLDVDGSPFDFRSGRTIGAQNIDFTFTDLARDDDGRAWVGLTAPDGTKAAIWADENYPFIELYTSHTQPAPYFRTGLGVEPMTCAPNAFRTGEGLVRLEPGQMSSAAWGISGFRG
ncbi:MAG: aldose 1-epimerase family protein [Jatrophihabitans sp.]